MLEGFILGVIFTLVCEVCGLIYFILKNLETDGKVDD